jgi:hypothetical protein
VIDTPSDPHEDLLVPPCSPCGSDDRERNAMAERLARVEPILALVVRDLGWPPEHAAAPDLDLLLSQPQGVIALSPSADVRIWIVLDGCPPDVHDATLRLSTGPLPPGVTRIRVH